MIARIIHALLDVYALVLIAHVIVSWLPVDADHPLKRVLRAATDPVLAPIRSVLPSTGPFDFSPLVALLLVRLLRIFLVG